MKLTKKQIEYLVEIASNVPRGSAIDDVEYCTMITGAEIGCRQLIRLLEIYGLVDLSEGADGTN